MAQLLIQNSGNGYGEIIYESGGRLPSMVERAHDIIEQNAERNTMLGAMDDFYFLEWEWPTTMPAWVRKTVSSDPYDALRSAVQILTTVEPRIKVHPVTEESAERETANTIEKGLRWFMWLAEKRSRSNLIGSIVQSACQYAMVAAQIVYLPIQSKKRGLGKISQVKYDKSGPFAIIVRNPRNVYPVYTDWGLSEVIFTKTYSMQEFRAFFGKEAMDMINLDEKQQGDFVAVYEHTDHERSYIWARKTTEATDSFVLDDAVGGIEIYDEEHGLGFIPWVIKQRGPGFYYEPHNNLAPLLYSVYKSKHWDTQNVVMSLLISEVIAHTGSPRMAVFSDNPDAVKTDYGDPERRVDAGPEDKIEPLRPPELDSGMSNILDMLSAMIGKETVARLIQNPEMKADVPFSSMNLIFQLGANTLNPFKLIAEEALAEIYEKMLYYIHKTGDTILAFSKERKDMGKQIKISPNMFDPENLYIEVSLTAEVPTDRLNKINAATIAVQNLDYSLLRALEDVGVSDPETVINEHEEDLMRQAKIQAKVKELMAMVDLKMMAMQQAQQQMQMAMQQGAAPMGESGMPTPGLPEQENIQGPGFAPNMGGMPPMSGSPNASRFEGATGSARTGEQLGGF